MASSWSIHTPRTTNTPRPSRSSRTATSSSSGVATESSGTDSWYSSIQGQRYKRLGNPVGGEVQVNTVTFYAQFSPAVAVESNGDFVVIWTARLDLFEPIFGISGQRYSSSGMIGSEFRVGGGGPIETSPAVAMDQDGDFVVVWSSYNFDYETSIQGQRYSSDGSALGSRFQVNTYTTGWQRGPSVAMQGDGDFVVVWGGLGSDGGDTSSASVQGQRYASGGTALGSQFQVNTYTTGWQGGPSVSLNGDGEFVVVWESDGSDSGDTSFWSIQGQRYTSGGALGSQFQVNTYTTSSQQRPSVSLDGDGEFVVVWDSYGSDGGDTSLWSVQGQLYSSGGGALGSQFQVNTYTTTSQSTPAVATNLYDEFVVVWNSSGSDNGDSSATSVQGQRFEAAVPLFADGFESGDTNMWSNSMP